MYEVNGAARRTYPRYKIEGQTREKQIEIRTDGKANAMTKSTEDIMVSTPQIRKLTPVECERLQSLPEVEKSCIIKVCLDHQNNYVSAENKNLKSQSVVGNVEKKDLKENVLSAKKNLNTKNLPINKPVQPDVLISCGENTLQIHYQGKLLASWCIVTGKQIGRAHV